MRRGRVLGPTAACVETRRFPFCQCSTAKLLVVRRSCPSVHCRGMFRTRCKIIVPLSQQEETGQARIVQHRPAVRNLRQKASGNVENLSARATMPQRLSS